jgi:hypothetical protein
VFSRTWLANWQVMFASSMSSSHERAAGSVWNQISSLGCP